MPFPLEEGEGSGYSLITAHVDPVSGTVPYDAAMENWRERLRKGGLVLIYGKSAAVTRFEKAASGLSRVNTRKYRGHRALLLKKA